MDNKERKAEIRKTILEKRDRLSIAEKLQLDEQLCQKIEALIYEKGAKIIHTYLPFGSEPDIRPLLQRLLDKNYTIICPKALPKRNLQNLVLTSLGELEEGRYGTQHPSSGIVHTSDIDFFIVPGVSFNNSNHRLGYGAGYYDTFFAANPKGYKLGVCYPFQFMGDFPIEAHDVPLDTVLY